jgi:hypothetical protein
VTVRRRERGSLSVFAAISAVGLIALCGLVLDGGGHLNAEEEASAVAREAARTACEQIDQQALRSGRGYVLDTPSALTAADAYLHTAQASGQPRVTGRNCVVVVSTQYPTKVLAIMGIGSLPIMVTETAYFVHGVNGPEGN